ncbi:MAG TPA: glycosyltransferase [Gemmatimonadaceae bacterium]|nr:glycosyltransferase [Gemmatimonadaceae bacterium]
MRVAIATDWLTSFGGAERVLQQLRLMYPGAPVYTSVYDPAGLPDDIRTWDVRPSVLQRLPVPTRYSRSLLPLMPYAFRRLDMSDYDFVISVSSAFSKSVRPANGAMNVCYCLSPPRYLWDLREEYLAGRAARTVLDVAATWLQRADRAAAKGVDEFVAISRTVADRVQRSYERDARIVYPPVDTSRLTPSAADPEPFYLVVSRLVAYKRIDLAIEACNRLRRKLIVVGAGPEYARLAAQAGPTVHLAGPLPDAVVGDLYARCRAFVFPGLEDFGIAPVEAQAAGRPVIAYGRGGAVETVLDGTTGVFFAAQTTDALVDAIERLDRLSVDPAACRRNAERFDVAVFRRELGSAVQEIVER